MSNWNNCLQHGKYLGDRCKVCEWERDRDRDIPVPPAEPDSGIQEEKLPHAAREFLERESWDRNSLYDTTEAQCAEMHNEALERVVRFMYAAFESSESAVRTGLRVEERLRQTLGKPDAPADHVEHVRENERYPKGGITGLPGDTRNLYEQILWELANASGILENEGYVSTPRRIQVLLGRSGSDASGVETNWDRDKDWVLAIGHALGLDSGFRVPIIPEVEPFKELFNAIRDAVPLSAPSSAEQKGT